MVYIAGLTEQLINVLNSQLENFAALSALAEEKKQAVIDNAAEALAEITSRENAVVGKMQKTDKARIALMDEIKNVLGIASDSYTLTDLCETVKGQNEYEALKTAVDATRDAAGALKAVNVQNKTLIENALEYIDFSVNVMRGNAQGRKFYNVSGEEIAQTSGFFDAMQ